MLQFEILENKFNFLPLLIIEQVKIELSKVAYTSNLRKHVPIVLSNKFHNIICTRMFIL